MFASGRIAPVGFFLLTFGFTWTAWLAPAALGASGDSGFFGLGGPVFLLGVFAPALVALAFTAFSQGRSRKSARLDVGGPGT